MSQVAWQLAEHIRTSHYIEVVLPTGSEPWGFLHATIFLDDVTGNTFFKMAYLARAKPNRTNQKRELP